MLDDLNGSLTRVEDLVEDLAAWGGHVLGGLSTVGAPCPKRRIIEHQGVLDGLGEVEEEARAVVEGVRVVVMSKVNVARSPQMFVSWPTTTP